ncbi:MAG: hypothetical protein GX160_08050 [Clostridiales bacterium]|nr:hypothetical protein [Clostridiales bacterium]
MTTVGLSSSLVHLKDELKNLGYEVYLEDEINFPVDVFIYSQDNGQFSLYSTAQKLDSLTLSNTNTDGDFCGTLLIDANGKSIDDIKLIIENRVYSPIF